MCALPAATVCLRRVHRHRLPTAIARLAAALPSIALPSPPSASSRAAVGRVLRTASLHSRKP